MIFFVLQEAIVPVVNQVVMEAKVVDLTVTKAEEVEVVMEIKEVVEAAVMVEVKVVDIKVAEVEAMEETAIMVFMISSCF